MEPIINDNNQPQQQPQQSLQPEENTQPWGVPGLDDATPGTNATQEATPPSGGDLVSVDVPDAESFPKMVTIYDRRSEQYVQVHEGWSLDDYWGQCHWHSHGVGEPEPDRGPQTIGDLFLACNGNYTEALYAELSREPMASKPYAMTMRGRIEGLAEVYRDLERVHSAKEDAQAAARKPHVERLMSSSIRERDAEDVKNRNCATLANFKVPSKDPYNPWEITSVSAMNSLGQKRVCGPALFVMSRTYAEMAELVASLVSAYRRANPVYIHNMATEHMDFLKTFWSPTPRPAYDPTGGADCNGFPIGNWHRYASGTDPRVESVAREDFSRALTAAMEPANRASQRRVVRRYYPEDVGGRWDIAGGWNDLPGSGISLDEPTKRTGRWALKNDAMPDDPVRRAGISGDHFMCCQMPRDHPGCFTDTFSTTTNQPVRYKAVWKRVWRGAGQDDAAIRQQWLGSTRRGTTWLDKAPYYLIHERIKALKLQLADNIVEAFAGNASPRQVISRLSIAGLNRMVQMLRLEDEYNSYWACGKQWLTTPLAWIKRIATTLLLDRTAPKPYLEMVAAFETLPEMHQNLLDKYAMVFAPALSVFSVPPVFPLAALPAEEEPQEEEQEEGDGGAPLDGEEGEGAEGAPLDEEEGEGAEILVPFEIDLDRLAQALDMRNRDLDLVNRLPEEIETQITALPLYALVLNVVERARTLGAGAAPDQSRVNRVLEGVLFNVLNAAPLIQDAIRIQLGTIAYPGQFTSLKDSAEGVVAELNALLRALEIQEAQLLATTVQDQRPGLLTAIEDESARLVPLEPSSAVITGRFKELVLPPGFPRSQESVDAIRLQKGGGGGGGAGGDGGEGVGGNGEEAPEAEEPLPTVKKEKATSIDVLRDRLSAQQRNDADLIAQSGLSLMQDDFNGLVTNISVAVLYGEIRILDKEVTKYAAILNKLEGVEDKEAARLVSEILLHNAMEKTLNVARGLVRLDVADRAWGMWVDNATIEAAKNSFRVLLQETKDASKLLRDFSPAAFMDVFDAIRLHAGTITEISQVNVGIIPVSDEVLFNRLAPIAAIAWNMKELGSYLQNKPTVAEGNERQHYWKPGNSEPNYDLIRRDIDRVLFSFKIVDNTPGEKGGDPILIPGVAPDKGIRQLGPEIVEELFRGGAGSIATRQGFAIKRDGLQYVVQELAPYDLRSGTEPAPNTFSFRVRIGWTKEIGTTKAYPGWWALQVFLKRYSDFILFMLQKVFLQRFTGRKLQVGNVRLGEEPALIPTDTDPVMPPKGAAEKNLEQWLHDSYIENGKPLGARSIVPDGDVLPYNSSLVKKNASKLASIFPRLASYFEANEDETAGEWDYEIANEVQAAPPDDATTAVAPPDLGKGEWDTWE